ncbi:MAG TPA: trypsin-like peptidase domain-containing protein [Anaeromyxobacteraceae bacterium]|nr:trypsin-like peptidase domain-containing protein [Anaeromyxobacteraceae bacterium]
MRRITTAATVVTVAIVIAIGCGASNGRAEQPAQPAKAQGTQGQLWRDPPQQQAAQASVPTQTSLAPIIKQLKPAVVNISTTTVMKNPHRNLPRGQGPGGQGPGGQGGGDDFFDFFGREMPEEFRGSSLGSGFIINSDGYVLTNNHVVKDAEDIKVRLSDGREFDAKVVGADAPTDVALIRLDKAPNNLPVVTLGDSDKIEAGDFVIAIGSPFNLRESATFGIISAKDRSTVTGSPFDDFLQTDAAINSGNSGGPLFNLRGEVVGINTAIVAPQIGSGVGFAVPVNIAKQIIPQLQAGRVARGYLGVTVGDLSADLAQAFKVPESTKGAVVQNVVPNAPAAKAGVQAGDIVVGVNGKQIGTSGELTRTVAANSPGAKVTLNLLRGGQKKDVQVTVGKRPDEEALARGEFGSPQEEQEGPAAKQGANEKLGMRVLPLTPELAKEIGAEGDSGVVVAAVTPNGPAEKAGIRRGDLVIELNRQPIARVEDMVSQVQKMKPGEMALLRIRRGNTAVFLPVRVGGEEQQQKKK